MYDLLILLIAGLGAGLITGFFSASAVLFAAPVLVLFLDMSAYVAVGISLAIDILASAVSAWIYYRNGHVKIQKSLLLLVFALIFVIIGSYLSKFIPSTNLSLITALGILVMGVLIYRKSSKDHVFAKPLNVSKHALMWYTILAGSLIGLIAGIFGAGGGIAILFALMFLLRFKIHDAIGTSVLLMIFIATTGSAMHFYFDKFPVSYLIVGVIGGIIGSLVASKIANKLSNKILTKIVGVVLFILGLGLLVKLFI